MTVCVRLVSSPKFGGFATRAYIPALKDGVLRAKLIRNRRAPRAAIASTVKGKLMQAAPYAAAAAPYVAAIFSAATPSLGFNAIARKQWDDKLRNCPTGVLGHDVLLNEDQPQGARHFVPVDRKSHLHDSFSGSAIGAFVGGFIGTYVGTGVFIDEFTAPSLLKKSDMDRLQEA
jgi:hypothetical protein